jgi:hypothetical protein
VKFPTEFGTKLQSPIIFNEFCVCNTGLGRSSSEFDARGANTVYTVVSSDFINQCSHHCYFTAVV